MSRVHTRTWRNGRVEREDFPLAELDQHLADPHTVVWADLLDPAPELLDQLAAELRLSPQAVEDSVAPGERPKAVRHHGHLFLTCYATVLAEPTDSGNLLGSRLELTRVSAFVMKGGVITVRRGDGFDMAHVVQRWEEDPELLSKGTDALVHGLLDAVVDGHFETIGHLDDRIEELEDTLFDDHIQTRTVQQRVYRLRKELVELRRVVLPMREVVAGVMRHRTNLAAEHLELEEPVRELDAYYQDLYDHVLRASEWTESLRDMVSTLFETNLSLQDARLNTVMKKLAGWGAIIAVPTAVTGWFGQNVPYPGFNSAFGFWQSVVLILVGTVGLYLLFRRQDWI